MRRERPVTTHITQSLPEIPQPPRTIRQPRQLPTLQENSLQRGLWFESGTFHVYAHELNGRGIPTGKLVRMGSYRANERQAADTLRNEINRQNPAFQAQIEIDERDEPDWNVMQEPSRRHWEGSVPIQYGPWLVDSTILDQYSRKVGWGIVSYFRDQSSAESCAAILNTENPRFSATAIADPEFEEK